ncbi:malonyl CoA-acyl carrier protein transacylase [Sideroxyarcus emersonii]|uniref:Malonyl CoA-acyl carrier protein transacylase n=1 Tax=Sideroxyarcus emersonii TaxID=2764705 RepID=A0AAN1XBT4_9PROT|nr:acyltransferase domain-containing protein [Sideroxyarcus emersonii]BCK88468.1 malonyl CoA-acyl carrier protein transacylase [Sideroxyarcus emersonii]
MRLAILCSGQAGQHRNMLDDLLVAPKCASMRQAASAVLGQDVAQWWNALGDKEIFLNQHAQFAIACYQLSIWARIAPLLPEPDLVAGYSLGELLAYHVAGALTAAETLRLVRARARLMDEAAAGAGSGCMVLWRGRVSPATLAARDRAISDYGLDIAIERRNGETVMAGPAQAIERFVADFQALNPGMVCLPVSIPAHSRYLAQAANSFRDILEASGIVAPKIPVLAGVDAMPVRSRAAAIDALSRQIATTIRWDGCMEALAESGIDKAIELGPGNDLAKLLAAEHPRVAAHAIGDFSDHHALVEWLK